jgi:3-oxoacid CoA-transferase subunit B
LAVLEITSAGFQLIERAPGVSIETIKKATEGKLIITGDIPEMKIN